MRKFTTIICFVLSMWLDLQSAAVNTLEIKHYQRGIMVPDTTKHKALIHIGMSKAGSTYIQGYIRRRKHALLKEEHYEMDYSSSWNGIALVHDLVERDKNILFSDERFWLFKPADVAKFEMIFANRYDVKIVFVYRELMSRTLSSYNQHKKHMVGGMIHNFFATHIQSGSQWDPVVAIEQYMVRFGLENVYVVDYYGALAAGKDLGEVIVCEIGGLLCGHDDGEFSSPHGNKSVGWIVLELLTEIMRRADDIQQCHSGTTRNAEEIYHSMNKTSFHSSMPTEVPMNIIPMDDFKQRAAEIDTRFRMKYGDRIMYSNVSANELMRRDIYFSQLNMKVISTDERWSEWIQEQAEELIKMNLVSCRKLQYRK